MIYFRHYVISRPRGFHLVLIQKNNLKKSNEKLNFKKKWEMKMNKMKTKRKQNEQIKKSEK